MKKNKSNHPLQTKAWGQFRREWGNEVLETKYGIIVVNRLPGGFGIGTFIRGPKPTQKMLGDLKEIAKEHNLIFIKLEPNVRKTEKLISLMKESGAVPGKTLFTPTTFQIDLAKSEEELLKSFHPKTRYNIRYAERKGVTVEEDPTPSRNGGTSLGASKAFDKYIELMRETVQRQGFYAHSERYHRLMWKHLNLRIQNSKFKIAHLLIAKHKKDILTAWILFKSKDALYYPYGASGSQFQNLQANSLIMWEAIRFGKKHKLKYFDLWGREPGKGFTRFKEGFNPEVVEFLGTWDLITSPLYWPYRMVEFFRWRILKLKTMFSKPSF
jgi:lipid II:glycine glycyltransferase (peptidoglycan interpeptide bridge formation enzyme)